MRCRSAARATCSATSPKPLRSWTPSPSSPAIPTSSSPPPRAVRGRPGSRTGSSCRAWRPYATTGWWHSRTRRSAGSARASSERPKRCAGRSPVSVAEIIELQGYFELGAPQQCHRRLQVIALLAGHPHLIALQARLYLELGVLDEPRDLFAGLLVDAVLEDHVLLGRREG